MSNSILFPKLNLQLFAEGGAAAGAGAGGGGTGAEGATGVSASVPGLQTKGVKNPLANVKYGIQDDAQTANVQTKSTDGNGNVAQPDRNAEFEKLIKGEYKDLYDARVQDTIQKRLKSTKETVDKYNELAPTLDMLARKYGISDASDIKALNKAIEEDDSYYEDEALEKGITNSVASCTLYIELGKKLYMSKGSAKNLKLTTTEDIEIFKALLNAKKDTWMH